MGGKRGKSVKTELKRLESRSILWHALMVFMTVLCVTATFVIRSVPEIALLPFYIQVSSMIMLGVLIWKNQKKRKQIEKEAKSEYSS